MALGSTFGSGLSGVDPDGPDLVLVSSSRASEVDTDRHSPDRLPTLLMTSALSSRLQICSAISFSGDIETHWKGRTRIDSTGPKSIVEELNYAKRILYI